MAERNGLSLYGQAALKKIHRAAKEGRLLGMAAKGLKILLTGHLWLVGLKLREEMFFPGDAVEADRYAQWRLHFAITDERRAQIRAMVAAMAQPAGISLIVPAWHDASPHYLQEMFESVLRQLYPHWELLVMCGPIGQQESNLIDDFVKQDRRISRVFCDSANVATGIGAALGKARGEFVGLMGVNDQLAEQALFRMAQAIEQDRTVDMLYSDEDRIGLDGSHGQPYFKPGWSPEYFLSRMYTSCLTLYRRSRLEEIGGFSDSFGPACEYDLAMRLTWRTSRVKHVEDVLYHRRRGFVSTFGAIQAGPGVHAAAAKALQANLAAQGRPVSAVEPGPEPGYHRVRFKILDAPKVTIVIPTACKKGNFGEEQTWFLLRCLKSIRALSTYSNYEILVADNADMPPELAEAIEPLKPVRISYTKPGSFNLSSKFNFAVEHASGSHVLLLNDDVEILTPDWIENMLEYSQQDPIGAVGGRLYFPNRALQHVGVILFEVGPGHPFYLCPPEFKGYHNSIVTVRNYSAVTGSCLMSRKSVYQEVGGFSEDLPLDYNDVDYCLKLIRHGYRVVYTPYTEICHYESATRSNTWESGLNKFKEKWAASYPPDPYYNRNLTQCNSDHRIGLPWVGDS